MADTVSRDVLRAVLEVRDRRHGETHAALLALIQALAAELVATGLVDPARLSARIAAATAAVSDDVHGERGRDVLHHTQVRLENPETPHWQAAPAPPES